MAAPIEQQVNGVENMVRLESESRNDGTYLARVRFNRNSDPNLAVVLVQNRVALAKPVLPDAVWQAGVVVSVKAAEERDANRVTIMLLDRGGVGRDDLRKFSDAVLKRLAAEKALVGAEAFPGPDVKQAEVHLDRAKCAEHGVPLGEALKVVDAAFHDAKTEAAKIEAMKALRVTAANGDKLPLETLATIELVDGPSAIFRVDMYPAARITGSPPQEQTAEAAARKCAELADIERKNQSHPDAFGVMTLTAR